MSESDLLQAISRVADELPLGSTERLAASIASAPDRAAARARSSGLIPHPRFTERFDVLFSAWEGCDLPPQAVALALRAAALRTDELRDRVRIEAVWTGPPLAGGSFRRTEQALLEVIRLAEARLVLVSYAVYRHAVLRGALVEAADRGVSINVVVESPEESQGRMSADALAALGRRVVARSTVLVWPAEKRPKDSSGHAGVLHAKCALADDTTLLVSSANLTESAMTNNIELGLLVRGGALPGRVGAAFDELRETGALVAVT